MQQTRTKQLVSTPADVPHERWRVVGLATLMVLAGVGLGVVGGAPRLPDGTPRPEQLAAVLSGSTLPVQLVAGVLVDLAWLMWGWIVGSLGLEVLVVAAEALAHGAAWARSLRRLADRVTFPLARRAVAAAFAVQILSRGVSVAAAQPLTPAETALVAEADHQTYPLAVSAAPVGASEPAVASYVVRTGDTLWSIADQAYGSGMAYRRLVDANVGRRMPDGHVFTARGVIRPGWELVVPEPNVRVDEVDGERWYTVEAGDTLSSIAARILGDDTHWTVLFQLNRGAPGPDGTHLLTNPDTIWPGLRLRLPAAVVPPVDEPETAPPDLVTASTPANAAPAPSVEASITPLDEQSRMLPPQEIDPLPLVRTLHVVEPVGQYPSAEPAAAATVPDDGTSPADEEVAVPTAPPPSERALVPAALGGLGLVALAGFALGARRMRRLRPLPQEPESEVVVAGGFAEAQLAHDFTRGLHGVGFDPVAAIVDQLQRFFGQYNLSHVKVVAVRHGRSATTVTLAAGLADQAILLDLAREFAGRLEAEVEAWISADQDVVYRLTRVRKTRLLPPADTVTDGPCLVPLGVLYDRQEYLATCSSLGHVLIASLPGHGADTILTSLLATLTARRSPQQLRVWLIARPRALAAPLFELPHLTRDIDPDDEAGLALAAEHLHAELDRRALDQSAADLVVVIPELTCLGDQAPSFELLASRAMSLGVRFIAATTCLQEAVQSPLLGHFGTRMVLRMEDEEASVALLGVADAAFLGGGGRLLLRLDGREPVELYGYHVAPEHLERLVRVMRSAYPADSGTPRAPARPAVPPSAVDDEPVPVSVSEPEVCEPSPPGSTPPPVFEGSSRALAAAGTPNIACPATPPAPAAVASAGSAGEAAKTPAPVDADAVASPAGAVNPANANSTPSAHASANAAVRATSSSHAVAASSGSAGDAAVEPLARANIAGEANPAGAVNLANARAAAAANATASPAHTTAGAGTADAANGGAVAKPPAAEANPAAVTHGAVVDDVAVVAARPPIEVICLGGPRVLCAGQQVWPRRPGGEAKPWEFLLYLAAQPAEGVSSADAVEALWPEDDEALDPAHRFRQLRYRLRHQLAAVAGAPATDGVCLDRGTLRLDTAVVYSDAQEFLGLVRTARVSQGPSAIPHLERARDLYQGDLLQGPDARRYAWVDERDDSGVTLREHFRRLFEQVSSRLAEFYAASGQPETAIDLYRELTELDPGDERLWRALFRIHADRGDRLALVREEHRLRAALRKLAAEVDNPGSAPVADPSRETVQEYHRLLDHLQEREHQAAAV